MPKELLGKTHLAKALINIQTNPHCGLLFSERLAVDQVFQCYCRKHNDQYCIINFISFLKTPKYKLSRKVIEILEKENHD